MTLDIRIETTYNTKYLSGDDLPDDGKDIIVKIKDVEMEKVENPKNGQSSDEIVIHFEGDVKPMVLSARCNKENIKAATGTGRTKEWVGKKLQLYREFGTWFGKSGFAIRVREFAPK